MEELNIFEVKVDRAQSFQHLQKKRAPGFGRSFSFNLREYSVKAI
jgi:hypothetical protein